MQKKIGRAIYDTEKADLLKGITSGEFGDPTGYEENLYKTAKGKLFVHGSGGADSKYPEENIITITEKDALAQFGVS